MKTYRLSSVMFGSLLGFVTLSCFWPANAFPPAPHHIIHGLVRDEMGNPISLSSAAVTLETVTDVSIVARVIPEVRPGENYRLSVPMDSFASPDPYKPTALSPEIPFLLKVRIGDVDYLPIEMSGDFATLGQPAVETLINLTLGVDSDRDGLPDAWERALIQMLGGDLLLSDIDPNADADGDGISNRDEYVSGTYAFDPEDGLKLALHRNPDKGPTVEFFAIAGRTYTVLGTSNLKTWTTMTFRVPSDPAASGAMSHYRSTSSRITEAEVVLAVGEPPALFFQLKVE